MTMTKADAQLIVASTERDANLLYATRFFAPDPFIYFRHQQRTFLVMSDLEVDRARRQASVTRVLSLTALEQELKDRKRRIVNTAAVLDLLFSRKRIRSVAVPADFPLRLADQLRRRGIRVIPGPEPFFPQRGIKTEDEIHEIVKVQRAAEAALEAGIALIRESRLSRGGILWHGNARLTAEAVKEHIAVTALRQGCVASHTIVACGVQGCDPHDEGSGPLKAHQPIILDVFPRSQRSGYWGDITRTVVKGRASEPLKAMFQTVLAGQSIALKKIKPTVKGSEVHQAVLDYFCQQGYETGSRDGRMQGFFHGTGHGVGLEIHEAPRLSPRGIEPLKAGHVVTVEPGLYYAGIGGVRIEDLVVVTATGYRTLTRFQKYLEV